jgi:hypothetical protein
MAKNVEQSYQMQLHNHWLRSVLQKTEGDKKQMADSMWSAIYNMENPVKKLSRHHSRRHLILQNS